eukprot:1412098-Prymnesium_polylepis.1
MQSAGVTVPVPSVCSIDAQCTFVQLGPILCALCDSLFTTLHARDPKASRPSEEAISGRDSRTLKWERSGTEGRPDGLEEDGRLADHGCLAERLLEREHDDRHHRDAP